MPKPVRRKKKPRKVKEADERDQQLADDLYSLSNGIHNLATTVGIKATQITMRLAENKNIPF